MVCKHSSNTSSESYGSYRNNNDDNNDGNNNNIYNDDYDDDDDNNEDEDDVDNDAVVNHETRLGWWFSRYSGVFSTVLSQF